MKIFSADFSDSVIPLEAVAAPLGCPPAASAAARQVSPIEGDAPPGVVQMSLMLTRRCNMSCAHCSVESSPHIKGEPTPDELLQAVRAARESGVKSILLTGGEPMLRQPLVLQLLGECQRLGMTTALTSNGFWGKTPQSARDITARLQAAGLQLLTLSYDRYHADFQGPQPAVNIAQAARAARLALNVSITRTAQDADLDAIVAPFEALEGVSLRFYDVQPIGRARDFDLNTLRGEVGGFCNACNSPALTDDGRLIACNGPAYFSAPESPLVLGELAQADLGELLRRHRNDPVLEAIRTQGPAWLLSELQRQPGFEDWARPAYGGMCDVCLHLNSDARAVAALRARLAEPSLEAERAARRQVIEATRGREWHRETVNKAGAARVWWRAMRAVATLDEAGVSAILGRADLNWNAQQIYLAQCGLAGALLPTLDHAAVKRWAPQFWRDKMRVQARVDALRALLQYDALREIAAVAREVGATGVVLKGGALLALDAQTQGALTLRAGGDLDIYFAPGAAERVHALLIERGFVPAEDGLQVSARQRHQLPGLTRGALNIEIHQTLMPLFCGLPEKTILRGARALQAPELRGLRVPGPEALLLHSALHCSKHLWTHGLKVAYDVAWIVERHPDLNWKWLRRLVARTGMKRGFWVPITLLARELELPIPRWFLRLAPRDARQQKLERIAGRHLFGATRTDFQDNPWICHPLYLLQSDNWWHRARHGFDLLFGAYARGMRQQRASSEPGHRRSRWAKLGRALRSWRKL